MAFGPRPGTNGTNGSGGGGSGGGGGGDGGGGRGGGDGDRDVWSAAPMILLSPDRQDGNQTRSL